ncbi:hypothetical protein Cgig2_030915 [Carnegiea gigantea]|uniref:Uncharacterized protein n=1 Tax=Carnegiea gigantea TaxID=171969 RepID=A0A9Q1QIP7_9CARY|nr:hypothetical protein Cgig2_030915 [Carnegiea gigantea]
MILFQVFMHIALILIVIRNFFQEGAKIQYCTAPFGIGQFKYSFVFMIKKSNIVYELVDNSVLSIKVFNKKEAMLHLMWNDHIIVKDGSNIQISWQIIVICMHYVVHLAIVTLIPQLSANGCVQRTLLICNNTDGFLKYCNVNVIKCLILDILGLTQDGCLRLRDKVCTSRLNPTDAQIVTMQEFSTLVLPFLCYMDLRASGRGKIWIAAGFTMGGVLLLSINAGL